MIKRLLIGLSLLAVLASLPIAPAIAEDELDKLVREAKDAADAAKLPDGYEELASGSMTDSLVSIALADGKIDEAIKLVKARREKYPNNSDSYSQMGQIKEEYLQDLPGAFQEYDEAKFKAFEALKAAQQKSGNSSPELSQYREAIVDNSQKAVSVLLTIADRDKNRQAFASAETMMKSADKYHKTAESFINRSRAIELILRSPKLDAKTKESLKQMALKGFAVAIKARPNLPAAYLYQGIFKARILKDQVDAKADLKKAYELAKAQLWKAGIDRSTAALKALEGLPEATAPTELKAKAAVTPPKSVAPAVQQLHFSQVSASVRASYNRGLAKFNQDDFKGAIAEFDQALKAQPNYPEALNWRGNVYRALNEPKKAMADFSQAIALKPDYSRPYNNRSLLKSQQLKDMEGAIADLNVAIRLEPTLAMAYDNRGRVFLQMQKTTEALNDFQQAVKLVPDNGKFHDSLCEAELTRYNQQAGFDACDRAITLGYKHPVTYTNRGVARKWLKDPQAIADFDEAIKLNPEEAAAYYNRGHLLIGADQAKRQAGIRDLETSLRLFKQQGSQSKEWLQNAEQEIASFKSPESKPSPPKQSQTAKDSLSNFDTFFEDFAKTLNEPEKKK